MKRFLIFCTALLFFQATSAQKKKGNESGYFSISRRTSVSMWGLNGWKPNGISGGTSFRIRFSKRLNSEWYGDLIKTSYKGLLYRYDRHLTNCLMWYLIDEEKKARPVKFKPFISASVFCLDITEITEAKVGGQVVQRFTFSQQLGVGAHYFLKERFDVSGYIQYYNHLGKHIHVHEHEDGELDMRVEKGKISLEGHLFMVFSVGYRFLDLWGKN